MRMSELFVAKDLRFFENSERQSREECKPDPAVDDRSRCWNLEEFYFRFILVQAREPQKAAKT